MFSWYMNIGMILYVIVGKIAMKAVSNYLKKLDDDVAAYDVRYCRRLYYHIPVRKTKTNEILVDALFMVFWPVICIVFILKAEWEYDTIVNHSVFRKRAS